MKCYDNAVMEIIYEKMVFRFDIDTHKCIRDGVPNLLELFDKYNVPFGFFLNTGKSISLKESIKSMASNNKEGIERINDYVCEGKYI